LKHSSIVKTLLWPDEAATEAFANTLAKALTRALPEGRFDACVALQGDLGAGKTTLVRYLLRALGVTGRIKSPTYAVVEPYELPGLALWHFDFYRFADPQEWEEAGFRDLFASPGLKLAEWPEKVASMLPVADVDIRLTTLDDGTRSVTLTGNTSTGETLVRSVMPAGGTA
jgi:tRNA threonylcarbamoyladenosine biosynthesis protein TsaE